MMIKKVRQRKIQDPINIDIKSNKMKTFQQFLDEALAAWALRAGLKQLSRNKAIQQAAARTSRAMVSAGLRPTAAATASAPARRISMTRLYHGTTQPASSTISRSGWRTDVNVTRQMKGTGVYTTPQRDIARAYASQRALQRGEAPAVRTFRVPTPVVQTALQRQAAQGQNIARKNFGQGTKQFNILQMSPQTANKYDITDKENFIRFTSSQRDEIRQAVRSQRQPQVPQIKATTTTVPSFAQPKPPVTPPPPPPAAKQTLTPQPPRSSSPYRNLGAGTKETVRPTPTTPQPSQPQQSSTTYRNVGVGRKETIHEPTPTPQTTTQTPQTPEELLKKKKKKK